VGLLILQEATSALNELSEVSATHWYEGGKVALDILSYLPGLVSKRGVGLEQFGFELGIL